MMSNKNNNENKFTPNCNIVWNMKTHSKNNYVLKKLKSQLPCPVS